MRTFREFKPEERRNYITLLTGEYKDRGKKG